MQQWQPHHITQPMCFCWCVVSISSQWKKVFVKHWMFLSALSFMLLSLQVSLMAQVNHSAIREKMNLWIKCSDLHSESFTGESTRPWLIQCSMTLWRSAAATVLDVVLKAKPYCYVSIAFHDQWFDRWWHMTEVCQSTKVSPLLLLFSLTSGKILNFLNTPSKYTICTFLTKIPLI